MDEFMKANELTVGLDCCYRYGKYVDKSWEFEHDHVPYKHLKLTQSMIDDIIEQGTSYIKHHNLMVIK